MHVGWICVKQGFAKKRAALVRAPGRRDVRVDGVGRQVEHRAVAARGRAAPRARRATRSRRSTRLRHTMPRAWPLTITRSSISRRAQHLDRAGIHLAHQRLVGAEQQLLPRLAARVEGARHLRAAERSVVEQAAVLAREGHALRHALVDDLHRQLRQPVDVGLARAVVAALDRVVEQPVDAVAVVAVVLRRVDPALGRDAVRPARAVVDAEDLHLVAELAQRRRRRRARQAGADDEHLELPPVGGVHELVLELAQVPLVGDGPARNPRLERHRAPRREGR